MASKGFMVLGSSLAMAPAIGSVTYFVVLPPLRKTMSQDITQIKTERDCFIVLTGKDKGSQNNSDSYLLACRTKSRDNSDFSFYYYISNASKTAIPVKFLWVKPENNDREITIKFFWRSNATLQANRHLESISWIKKDGQDFNLPNLCKKTVIHTFNEYSKRTLICHREVDGEEQQEAWLEFSSWGI